MSKVLISPPHLRKLLTDKHEPMWMVSMTERENIDPKLAKPRRDNVEPSRATLRSDMEEPSCRKSITESDDPILE
jgi:hypothetical protein